MRRLENRFVDPEEMAERMFSFSLARNIAIRPTDRGSFRSTVNAARLSNIAILSVSMTPARVISPDKLGYTSVAFAGPRPAQAPINGRVESVTSDCVSLHDMEDPLDFRFLRESEILVVNLVDQSLDDFSAAMAGGAERESVRLPPMLRLDHPATQLFKCLTQFLYSEIRRQSPLTSSNLVVDELETALISSLLLAADSHQPDTRETALAAHVQRAVDYIMANLSQPLLLGEIAAAAGIQDLQWGQTRLIHRARRERDGSSKPLEASTNRRSV